MYKITLLKTGIVMYAATLERARELAFYYEHLIPSIRIVYKQGICVINILINIKGILMFNIIYSVVLVSVVCIAGVAIGNDISFYDAVLYIYYRM